MKRLSWLLIASLVVACDGGPGPVAPQSPNASLNVAASRGPLVGPDDWIVVFRDDVVDPPGLARQLIATHGGSLRFTYQYALKGFAATLPAQALNGIRNNPNVEYVEADGVATIDGSGTYKEGSPGSWGLDRIDESDRPLDGVYSWDFHGTGVHAYIIDTGIRKTHSEFGNRASADFDALGGDGSDCYGHGTHVAGTIGGETYGVAKGVWLHGVRVLNCSGSGTWSGVILGIDWVTNNHISPAIANMSLGGQPNTSVDQAVRNSIALGVTYTLSGGNDYGDACDKSPARTVEAITVGSTTSSDAKSSFSNTGSCVDIFAPGSSITSAWKTNDDATNTISGTSMAAPHVAGAAALILEENDSLTPAQVRDMIVLERATSGVLSGVGSGPNLLLCSLDDCSEASGGDPIWTEVTNVSEVTLSTARKHKSGTVYVTVSVVVGGLANNVTAAGEWYKNGETSPAKAGEGVTGTGGDGVAEITSGSIKGASTLEFCVISLSGPGYATVAVSPPECSGEAGSDPTGPPSGLAAIAKKKGKARVNLSWKPGGAPTVAVQRWNGESSLFETIAKISNDGSHTDWEGLTDAAYRVCLDPVAAPAICTNEATASP